jgi:magnesium chelatase subunit D
VPPDPFAAAKGAVEQTLPASLPAWPLALAAAVAFAVDPAGLGGVVLRGPAGPVRDRWLLAVRRLLPAGAPWVRIPLHVGDSRLLGGLDLAATLRAGRPVAERGLLADAHGGVVVLPMAERVAPATAARLTAALDTGQVLVERDAIALQSEARFGVIALDEGEQDERPPAGLRDRLGLHVDLTQVRWGDTFDSDLTAADVAAARMRLPRVTVPDPLLEALTAAAAALGVASLRAPRLALAAARIAAALDGRDQAGDADAALAAQLVLAPRATRWPPAAQEAQGQEQEAPPEPPSSDDDGESQPSDRPLQDVVLEAARASIPPGLLQGLQMGEAPSRRGLAAGRAGQMQRARLRGRPAGTRAGELRAGQRLNVVETLRAAAPWQPVRRRLSAHPRARVLVRPEDFRIARYTQRSPTTTLFVVDASGSAALHRLAEAKGAVELLLADCYVRRDRVALVAFRGQGAELVLPPTRSLVRARRLLAGLPAGGGTPLAAGIDLASELAEALARRGDTPVLVLLTDGRANVARDGSGGREAAQRDALAAARRARVTGCASLLIDTAPRPEPQAERLAAEMGARYLPLPHADAQAVSRAARAAADSSR